MSENAEISKLAKDVISIWKKKCIKSTKSASNNTTEKEKEKEKISERSEEPKTYSSNSLKQIEKEKKEVSNGKSLESNSEYTKIVDSIVKNSKMTPQRNNIRKLIFDSFIVKENNLSRQNSANSETNPIVNSEISLSDLKNLAIDIEDSIKLLI